PSVHNAGRRACVGNIYRIARRSAPATTAKLGLDRLDLVGLVHQRRTVAKFAQPALARQLFDLFFILSENPLHLVQLEKHLGHHGGTPISLSLYTNSSFGDGELPTGTSPMSVDSILFCGRLSRGWGRFRAVGSVGFAF